MSNTLVKKGSFYPPLRAQVAGKDGLLGPEYVRFNQQVWERLFTLGVEQSIPMGNGVENTTFATTDVDTTDDEITFTAHPFSTGYRCRFTTTGTLPGGLATSTDYWLIKNGTNTVQVAASRADAFRGDAKNLTSVGSGTHTIQPYGPLIGLNFNHKGTSGAIIDFFIQRVTTGGGAQELLEYIQHCVVWRPTLEVWDMATANFSNKPDNASVNLSITATGQVEYQAQAITGTDSISKLTYRARTFQAKNTYSEVGYI